MAADTLVEYRQPDGTETKGTDYKLFLLTNSVVATYGESSINVSNVMSNEMFNVGANEICNSILSRFSQEKGFRALVAAVNGANTFLYRVVIATNNIEQLQNTNPEQVTIWCNENINLGSFHHLSIDNPMAIAQNMLDILRIAASQSPTIGSPYDFVILNANFRQNWRIES